MTTLYLGGVVEPVEACLARMLHGEPRCAERRRRTVWRQSELVDAGRAEAPAKRKVYWRGRLAATGGWLRRPAEHRRRLRTCGRDPMLCMLLCAQVA